MPFLGSIDTPASVRDNPNLLDHDNHSWSLGKNETLIDNTSDGPARGGRLAINAGTRTNTTRRLKDEGLP